MTPTTHIEQGQFAIVPLADIVSSPTNPRKTFDAGKLAELADTIKATGVHTPILLRYLPASRLQETFFDRKKGDKLPQYEIVAGERRYRASVIAGIATIPALIRAMSDTQALEVQMIENLQRDDLSELEEAEGYQQLCDLTHIAKDALAEKIGRSRRYVYNRLRLLKLQPLARDALRDGKIDATAALAIATVHDSELQTKALAHALSTDYAGDKPSTRGLQKWMRMNVMLELAKAPFDIKLATLQPDAGPCTTCPKRTGADPDMFAETQGPDMCCDAPCYHAKTDESTRLAREKFTTQGIKIIEGDEAEELSYNNYSNDFNGYIPLSQTRNDTTSGQPATLLDLMGKKGQQEVGVVAIEHPQTKDLRVYVNADKAEAWLLAHGLVVAVDTAGKGGGGKPINTQTEAARQLKSLLACKDARIEDAGSKASDKAVQNAVLKTPARLLSTGAVINQKFMSAYLMGSVNVYYPGVLAVALDCEREPGAKPDDYRAQLEAAISRAEHSRVLKAFTLVMLERMKDEVDSDEAVALLQDVEIDLYESLSTNGLMRLSEIKAEAENAEREAINAEATALEAQSKPPKIATPKPPLAQPSTLPKKSKFPAGAAKPTLKPKKAKLTPGEAQLGIAYAMQNAGDNEGADAPTQGAIEGVAAPESTQEVAAVAAAAPVAFTAGQRVKVLSAEPLHLQKYIGKVGKIKKACGDNFDVAFHGAGIAEFEPQELQAVPA